MDEVEVPLLSGGSMIPVVRVGDTVRREPGPWTPTVRRLLIHLREKGFTEVPEPLGIDSRGREIVGYIDGDLGHYPVPTYVWSAATLEAVARLFRHFHDASEGFPAEHGDRWQLPERRPNEIICHNDLAPYNIVFRDGNPVGIIDFDASAPGPRVWDLAHAAYRFVPLAAPDNPDVPVVPLSVQAKRLTLFLESYGPEIGPADVMDLLPTRLEALIEWTGVRAQSEKNPVRDALKEHRNTYERDMLYISKHQAELASG